MDKEVIYVYVYTHTHNGILLRHKENKMMPFAATQMDLDIILLNEILQKFHMVTLICEIKKNETNELVYKTERDTQN